MDRRQAAQIFSLLARLWLVLVAAVTARGVIFFVPGTWEAVIEMVFFLGAEVVVAMQFWPAVLMAALPGNWIAPLVPLVRFFVWIVWPIYFVVDLLVSVLHLSEDEQVAQADDQQAIEALVDQATDEGIIEEDQARLIEQVVEFGDKRVRDVMTPRPDVVAIPASATLEELRQLVVKTKFSRLPVYEKSLDDILGIAFARDMLAIPERDAAQRTVRELMRPVIFVPELKFGSELLKEMQHKNQQMAVVIDEYGMMAGVVTVEDLVEEIIGDIGEEDRRPAPDVIREAGGTMVLREASGGQDPGAFRCAARNGGGAFKRHDDRGASERSGRARAAHGRSCRVRWLALRSAGGESAQGTASARAKAGNGSNALPAVS